MEKFENYQTVVGENNLIWNCIKLGPAEPWLCPAFANSVYPDQLASRSALFAIKYVLLY